MSENYAIDRDLNEAEAMVGSLSEYVRGTNLYGSVGGGLFSSKMPSLTVGAILLRLRRLRALENELTAVQRGKLSDIEAEHASIRKEWRAHYTEKLNQEALSRLKAIRPFFEECRDNPRSCPSNYPPEVLRRTIVQEIIQEMESLDLPLEDIEKEAKGIDSRLRSFTKPHDFVWASGLEPAYPKNVYWWLYAKPPKLEEER